VAEPDVPVLIAGGSLVGLTASALLAAQGVSHILVERHRGTAIHPRAASFHQRTMEIFRGLGLQAAVEQAAAREFVQNGAIVAVDSLSGRELACFYRSFNDGVEGLSPTARLFITQVGLEPLLRARAAELGADHLFGTELTGFTQDVDGVTATLRARDGGALRTLRARCLIAADGAHSPIREALGIGMEGRGSFADCATIYFRADVRALIGERNLSVVYVNRPDLLAFFRFSIAGDAGFLAVFATFDGNGMRDSHVAEGLSAERSAALVRTALGAPADFPVEIENVQPWQAMAASAGSFRKGRVFLAGDAAHVMPPTGGFGGNTGVGDAHNLAWKLAMVLRGEAGETLLDSYDAERRPVASLIVEQAYARYVQRVDPSLPADDLAVPLDDASIELGPIYRSAAVLGEGEDDDAPLADPRQPGGRPGTRVPHVVLERDGAPLSTLDLAGPDFLLLAGADGQPWTEAAAGLDPPLRALRVAPGEALTDPGGGFEAALGIGAGGAVVLRPDSVVGWRRADAAPDPAATLAAALRRLSFR
jgi:2-polyprenyl-6-methoxyphenol hydroxylase-like FAD-dependent oxidoreductase